MTDTRRFLAYANDESRSHAHPIPEADGFLDAAVQFAERWSAADAQEVAVTVEDCETGERHCFRIDLDTGQAGAC